MVVYKHDSRPWLIGYSGGKDSTLLVSLVYEAAKRLKALGDELNKTIYVITSDTMVENPIVKEYMHSSSKSIGKAAKSVCSLGLFNSAIGICFDNTLLLFISKLFQIFFIILFEIW